MPVPVVLNWTERLFQARCNSNDGTVPLDDFSHETEAATSPRSTLQDPTTPISPPLYRPPSTKTNSNASKLTEIGLRACLVNTLNINATDLRKQVCSTTKTPATREQIIRELRRHNFSLEAVLSSRGRTAALEHENHEQYLAAARSHLAELLGAHMLVEYQKRVPPIFPHTCAAYYAEQVYAHAAVFIRDAAITPMWKQSARGTALRNVLERYYEKLAHMLFSLMHGTTPALDPKYGRILQRKMRNYYQEREKQDRKAARPPLQKQPQRQVRPSNYFRSLRILPMQPEQLQSRYWNRQTLCKLSEFTSRWMLYCCLPKEQLRELERALNAIHGPVVTSTLHYTLIPDEKMYEQMQRDKRKLDISLRGLPNEVIQQAVGKFKESLFKFYDDHAMKSIAWNADDEFVTRRTSVISGIIDVTAAVETQLTSQPSKGAQISTERKSSTKIMAAVGQQSVRVNESHACVVSKHFRKVNRAHVNTIDAHKTSPLYTKLLLDGKAQRVKPQNLELPDKVGELIELENGQVFRKVVVPVYPQCQQQPSSLQKVAHDDSAASASRSVTICRPIKMRRHQRISDDDDGEIANDATTTAVRRRYAGSKTSNKRLRRGNFDDVSASKHKRHSSSSGRKAATTSKIQPHHVGYPRWTKIPYPLHKRYFTDRNPSSDAKNKSQSTVAAAEKPLETAKSAAPKQQLSEHALIMFITMREWAHQIGLSSLILEENVDYTVWPAALISMLTDLNVSKRIAGCLLLLHLKPIEPEELVATAAHNATDGSGGGSIVTAEFVRKCQRHVEKWRAGCAQYIDALRVIVDDIRENEQVRKAATMALIFAHHNKDVSDKNQVENENAPRYPSNSSEIQVLLNMLHSISCSIADRVAACVFLAFCRIRTERLVHELGLWLFSTSTNNATSQQRPAAATTTRKIIQYACGQVGRYDSRMVTVIFSGVASFHYEKRLIGLETLPLVVSTSSSKPFLTHDMKLHITMLALTEQHPQVKQRACWAALKLGLARLLHRLIAQTLQCRAHHVKSFPCVTTVRTDKCYPVDSYTKLNALTALRTATGTIGSLVLTGDVIECVLDALHDPSHIIRLEAIKCVASNSSPNQSLLETLCETAQTDALEIVRDAAVRALLTMPDALTQSCVRSALLFLVRFDDSAAIRRRIIDRLIREPLYAASTDFYDGLQKKMLAAETKEVREHLRMSLNRMEQNHPELKISSVESSGSAFDEAGADENIAQMVKANLDGYVAQQHLKQIMFRVACKLHDKKHAEFRHMFIKHFQSGHNLTNNALQPTTSTEKNRLDGFFNELSTAVDVKKPDKPKKTRQNDAERLQKYVQTTTNKHKHYGVRRSTPITMAADETEPVVKHWIKKYETDDETGRLTVKDDWKAMYDKGIGQETSCNI